MTPREVIDRYDRLAGQRTSLLTHWQEIADLADPSRARFITQTDNNGLRPKVQIYDNTGIIGARTLASAIHGMLTNPAQEWFEMTTGNQQLDSSDDARTWLEEVAKIMHQLANILEDLECEDQNITLNVKQCIWVIEGIANAIVAGESTEEMESLYSKLEKHVNVPVPL